MIEVRYLIMSNIETRLEEIEKELDEMFWQCNEEWERSDYKDHISAYQRNLLKMASDSVDVARMAVNSANNIIYELTDLA